MQEGKQSAAWLLPICRVSQECLNLVWEVPRHVSSGRAEYVGSSSKMMVQKGGLA